MLPSEIGTDLPHINQSLLVERPDGDTPTLGQLPGQLHPGSRKVRADLEEILSLIILLHHF